MYELNSQTSLIIQALIGVIIVGVFYNLWVSTRMYGGIIGTAIRLLGVGMLFVTIATFERVLVNFNIIQSSINLAIAQDIFNVIGLVFLGLGFSKLASGTKA
jgi:hypothetical protein